MQLICASFSSSVICAISAAISGSAETGLTASTTISVGAAVAGAVRAVSHPTSMRPPKVQSVVARSLERNERIGIWLSFSNTTYVSANNCRHGKQDEGSNKALGDACASPAQGQKINDRINAVTKPTPPTTVDTTVQDFSVSLTDKSRYLLTSQNPESLT